MARIIDLSREIKYNSKEPFFMRIKIKHKAHKKSKNLIRFLIKLPFSLFPKNFIGWADDTIEKMGVHSSTHLDAPWHYSPTVGDQAAKTVDEIPLEWCYGDGIVIDMSHKKDFEIIGVEDIKSALKKIRKDIEPGNIVLIRTDRDRYMGSKEFVERGTGMSREATEWIIDKGVKVMGIDQWGWDLPLFHSAKEAKKNLDKDFFWQGHLVGQEKEYCHIEQLTNLKELPAYGFKVAVFPLKIVGASAAPARVVAILEG